MDRLLDPKNDLAFKQVFGEESRKRILIKFLNDIYSGQTTRYKEGLAKGIEKGRAEEKIAVLKEDICAK